MNRLKEGLFVDWEGLLLFVNQYVPINDIVAWILL